MMWQGAGNPGGAYGLQQAMAAQAAAQQQQQQQTPGMQVCTVSGCANVAALSVDNPDLQLRTAELCIQPCPCSYLC